MSNIVISELPFYSTDFHCSTRYVAKHSFTTEDIFCIPAAHLSLFNNESSCIIIHLVFRSEYYVAFGSENQMPITFLITAQTFTTLLTVCLFQSVESVRDVYYSSCH